MRMILQKALSLEFARALTLAGVSAYAVSMVFNGANGLKNLGFYACALSFILVVIRSGRNLPKAFEAGAFFVGLVAILSAGLWGSLGAADFSASWTEFFRRENIGMSAVVALFVLVVGVSESGLRFVWWLVVMAFIPECVLHLLDMINHPVFLRPNEFPYELLWRQRDFAEHLLIGLPLFWASWALFQSKPMRALAILLTVLALGMSVPTGYRGAWLAMIVVSLIWLGRIRLGRRVSLMGAVAVLGVAGLIVTFAPKSTLVSTAIERGVSDSNRMRSVWVPTASMISDRPFRGYGFSHPSFGVEYIKRMATHPEWGGEAFYDPHNNYLALAFGAGVCGAMALLWVTAISVWKALLVANSTDLSVGRRRMGLALTSAWVGAYFLLALLDIVNWNCFGLLVVLTASLLSLHPQKHLAWPVIGRGSGEPLAGRNVLFIIRDKLGDTLLAFSVVQAYLQTRPEDRVTVLMRTDYADLVEQEKGFRLVRYHNSLATLVWALWERVIHPRYDAAVVLRGFGDRTIRLGRLLNAKRKIAFSGRLVPVFDEFPPSDVVDGYENASLIEASFRAAQLLEPNLARPVRLDLASLQNAPVLDESPFVAICPITDEKRKDLTRGSVAMLIDLARVEHPGLPIRILVRERAEALFGDLENSACTLENFQNLERLVKLFQSMVHYYGADTGLYHLAVAMGRPATVIFGPTQPGRIVLQGQEAARTVRLKALGNRHCDEKRCLQPVCIEMACANLVRKGLHDPMALAPATCPLRSSGGVLSENQVVMYPNEIEVG